MNRNKEFITKLCDLAGITINGSNPFDIQIHDEIFYDRVTLGGSLALGESYMEGVWGCKALDQFVAKLLDANLETKVKTPFSFKLKVFFQRFFNPQSREKSKKLVSKHYDIGNDLYQKMLDPHMQYTCGYWKNVSSLEEAQIQKMDLICRKLKLEPGMTLLDIGCGWGGFSAYAARNYQVKVLGVTLSKEQQKIAEMWTQGLPVEIKLQDYRDVVGQFDRVVSVGMIEHVGYRNYGKYMEVVDRLLKPDGITMVHTIGSNETNFSTDPWIEKYIFQNSLIPSMAQLSIAMEPYFVLQDVHNFGPHYDKTLMAWLENFRKSWPELESNYGNEFYRMWEYYLNTSAASFRIRKNNLWQIIMTKRSFLGEYIAVR